MFDVTQFSRVVWAGDLDAVNAMMAAGADVNTADEPHDPPIHLAIEQEWLPIVRRLVEAGALINRDLRDGWTPLVHAIDIESDGAWQAHHETGHGSTELTELLLEAGAIPTDRAFQIARNYDHRRALDLLDKYSNVRTHGE